jgi:aryl-phospho-beta-D-glucosidase BglC (GH1 family)
MNRRFWVTSAWLAMLALVPCGAWADDALPTGSGKRQQARLEFIRVSDDGAHFVRGKTDERFVLWGVNYDHDDSGRLLEDYWEREWETVAEDFREIKALGANVVRIHLQLARFMETADQPNRANLDRLANLVKLAEETGLYLDVTGLG